MLGGAESFGGGISNGAFPNFANVKPVAQPPNFESFVDSLDCAVFLTA